MPYLGSYTGDYLGSYRGDPGFLDFVKKGIKYVGGKLLGAHPLGGVVKTVGGAALGAARGRSSGRTIVEPVVAGGMPRMTAKGAKAAARAEKKAIAAATGQRTYRRMNVTNPKALRRAIRRQQGFVKLARRALRGTGYTVTSRGRSRPRAVTVRESGPGNVVVR